MGFNLYAYTRLLCNPAEKARVEVIKYTDKEVSCETMNACDVIVFLLVVL